jgi:hypothetical protein
LLQLNNNICPERGAAEAVVEKGWRAESHLPNAEAIVSTSTVPETIPLSHRESVVVVAASFQKARQLSLKLSILVLKAVGVRAELLEAADDVLNPGAEHARMEAGNETRTEDGIRCRPIEWHERQRPFETGTVAKR